MTYASQLEKNSYYKTLKVYKYKMCSVASSVVRDAMRSHLSSLRILQLRAVGDTMPKSTTDWTALKRATLRSARIFYAL